MPPNLRHRRPPQRPSSPDAPTPIDRRRWSDFRAGISVEELATRENVRVGTIDKSIDKMRTFAARVSQESTEMATRELYLNQLPNATHVFEEALLATKLESYAIVNPDTGETEVREREVADHVTRLKAMEQLKGLLASIQPKQPMVAVDARTQINNGQQSGQSHQGALSAESIIRQIRADKNLALGSGAPTSTPAIAPPAEVDFELEAEMEEEGDPDEIEAEYVDEDNPILPPEPSK